MEDRSDEAPPLLTPGIEAGAAAATTPPTTPHVKQQQERRNSIRNILADDSLSALEKRRSIQSLMDGRSSRRGSMASHGSYSSMGSTGSGHMILPAHPPQTPPTQGNDSDAAVEAVTMTLEGTYVGGGRGGGGPPFVPSAVETSYYGYEAPTTIGGQVPGSSQSSLVGPNSPNAANTAAAAAMTMGGGNRKQRATSMPMWSEDTNRVAAAAPLVAGTTTAAAAGSSSSNNNNNNNNDVWNDPIHIHQRMEKSRPPCQHYERNCTIVSPCCGLAFGCRICHDDCPVLPMPFAKRPPVHPAAAAAAAPQQVSPVSPTTTTTSTATQDSAAAAGAAPSPRERILNWDAVEGLKQKHEKRRSLPLSYYDDEETHHEIDRFAIAEVICRLCYARQSSKTNFCASCGAQFGAYHCIICNLWMADDEQPYHCADCGFCRVGGRENFRHCHDCGMCIDTTLFEDHNCKAGKYMSNCPVCQEDLFSSRDASHEMPCGHAIHWHCFKELTSYDTRCPVCKKTAETPEHMASTWHAMAVGIALQPVPPELARVVNIMCNDCEQDEDDRRWHFLGVRCNSCGSFNTSVERTTLTGREAALYLDELDRLRGVEPGSGGDDEATDSNGMGGEGPDDENDDGGSSPRSMDAS